jgi:hypothetical protein
MVNARDAPCDEPITLKWYVPAGVPGFGLVLNVGVPLLPHPKIANVSSAVASTDPVVPNVRYG